MSEEFKKGDKVEWKTSQGTTTGVVKKKLTSPKHDSAPFRFSITRPMAVFNTD